MLPVRGQASPLPVRPFLAYTRTVTSLPET